MIVAISKSWIRRALALEANHSVKDTRRIDTD